MMKGIKMTSNDSLLLAIFLRRPNWVQPSFLFRVVINRIDPGRPVLKSKPYNSGSLTFFFRKKGSPKPEALPCVTKPVSENRVWKREGWIQSWQRSRNYSIDSKLLWCGTISILVPNSFLNSRYHLLLSHSLLLIQNPNFCLVRSKILLYFELSMDKA